VLYISDKQINKILVSRFSSLKHDYLRFLMARTFRKILITLTSICILIAMDSCRHKGPYNPYLHMKTKPSEQQAKEKKRILKRGNRAYKKQLGDNRKQIFGRRKPPKQ